MPCEETMRHNYETFVNWSVGDKVKIQRPLGKYQKTPVVDYGHVVGFEYNVLDQMILVVDVVGCSNPQKLFPTSTAMYEIHKIQKQDSQAKSG
jgi:hypothetical protein